MANTWSDVLSLSRALLNDQEDAVYHDSVLVAYLNIALAELEETFELNNIPITNRTSAVINVPAGITVIGFKNTVPQLPPDLVEIQELFESDEGQNVWSRVAKQEFLTAWIPSSASPVTKFGVWSWENQEIHVLPSLQPNDLKLNYIASIFPELTVPALNSVITILNCDTFIQNRVAGLAAEFIQENFVRADKLNMFGASSLQRSLGISVKGQQQIPVRRRPFRASFKNRRSVV